MKKRLFAALGFCTLLICLVVPATSNAGVNVSINVPLPGLVISAPPAMVVIPGTYVYYPPDVAVDIFFYHGYWYRPYRGGWFVSSGYNGPWRGIGVERVHRPILGVPPHFRGIPPEHERIPYRDMQRNWRGWERDRHWDRREARGERRERRHEEERDWRR